MTAFFQSPLILLGSPIVLSAGVLGVLAAGMGKGSTASWSRLLAIGALILAGALALGGIPGGFGPLVRLDGLGLSWQVLFCAGALPFAFLAGAEDEIPPALLLGSVLGMALLASSWSLLMLFIGLELMSLPAYLLVARTGPQGGRALEAAVKYFFAGGAAGALFLLGMALYYVSSRSLALIGAPGPIAEAGLALMGAAALFKVGAVPLHFWLPDVYEASPPELAGFLSTAMKAAGVLLLMRLAALLPQSALAGSLASVGAVTMIFGSLLALRQDNLQRLLAYASIAHAGNIILGVGAWAAQGALPGEAAAVFFYLAAYLVMSNGVFAALKASGARSRQDLRGLARREPLLAAALAALLLAQAGIPPTAGFLAKLLIFWEALKAGLYGPLAAAGLSALIALGYYLSLVRDMYFEEGDEGRQADASADAKARLVVYLCAIPAALLGLAPWLLGAISGALAR